MTCDVDRYYSLEDYNTDLKKAMRITYIVQNLIGWGSLTVIRTMTIC